MRLAVAPLMAAAFSCALWACDSSGGSGPGYYGPVGDAWTGDTQGGSDASDKVPITGQITVETPRLAVFGDDVFPTYIAHVFGQISLDSGKLHFVREVAIANGTDQTRSLVVTAELQGYSHPATEQVTLAPGERRVLTPSLTFKYDALYALSATVTSNFQVTVSEDGQVVATASKTLKVAPKNTVFWSVPGKDGQSVNTMHLIAALVTPHDAQNQIDKLLTEAAGKSAFGKMIGYQYADKPKSFNVTADANDCVIIGQAFYQAGQQVQVKVNMDDDWAGGYYVYLGQATAEAEPVWWAEGTDFAQEIWTAPEASIYTHYACSNDSYPVKFEGLRTIGLNEGAADQIGAIHEALRARGMVYAHVPQAYFGAASQNVKTPAESLISGSQNCIDGSLVFASALEAMGMNPGIVFVPGHAFVAVQSAPGVDHWIFLETTMVGTSPAGAAISKAFETFNEAASQGTIDAFVSIQAMRAQQLVPAPM